MRQKEQWPWDNEILLLDLIMSAKDHDTLKLLLDELLTPKEKLMFQTRVGIAKALLENRTYEQIEAGLGVSSYIIARTNRTIVRAKSSYIASHLAQKSSEEEDS